MIIHIKDVHEYSTKGFQILEAIKEFQKEWDLEIYLYSEDILNKK